MTVQGPNNGSFRLYVTEDKGDPESTPRGKITMSITQILEANGLTPEEIEVAVGKLPGKDELTQDDVALTVKDALQRKGLSEDEIEVAVQEALDKDDIVLEVGRGRDPESLGKDDVELGVFDRHRVDPSGEGEILLVSTSEYQGRVRRVYVVKKGDEIYDVTIRYKKGLEKDLGPGIDSFEKMEKTVDKVVETWFDHGVYEGIQGKQLAISDVKTKKWTLREGLRKVDKRNRAYTVAKTANNIALYWFEVQDKPEFEEGTHKVKDARESGFVHGDNHDPKKRRKR